MATQNADSLGLGTKSNLAGECTNSGTLFFWLFFGLFVFVVVVVVVSCFSHCYSLNRRKEEEDTNIRA